MLLPSTYCTVPIAAALDGSAPTGDAPAPWPPRAAVPARPPAEPAAPPEVAAVVDVAAFGRDERPIRTPMLNTSRSTTATPRMRVHLSTLPRRRTLVGGPSPMASRSNDRPAAADDCVWLSVWVVSMWVSGVG